MRKEIFKFWSLWEWEEQEKWLHKKVSRGWILEKVDQGLSLYIFKSSEGVKTSYCCDYQTKPDPQYYSIAEDAGWQLVNHTRGVHIWSKEYEGDVRPEFLSDPESLISKIRKILTYTAPIFLVLIVNFMIFYKNFTETDSVGELIVLVFLIVLTVVMGIRTAKLFWKFLKLKKKRKY